MGVLQSIGVTASNPVTSLQSGAFGSPIVAGNTIIVAVYTEDGSGSGNVTGATDTNGNTYTIDKQALQTGANDRCALLSVSNCLGGANNKITVTTTGNAYITIGGAIECAGLLTASPLDGAGSTNVGVISVTNPSTGTYSTTNANDLLAAAFAASNVSASDNPTDPSGFIRVAIEKSSGSFEDGIFCYKPVSAAQTNINPTWSSFGSSTGRWACIGLAYKAPSTSYTLSFDAASNSGYQASASSLSWAHVWNWSNKFLAIDVHLLSVNDTVTACTYGGATCTLVGAQNVAGGTGRVEQWRIKDTDSGAPAAGSNTISVTISGSLACAGTAVSYNGVDQTTPTEAFNGASGVATGTTASVIVTTVLNNDWVHAALATNTASGVVAGQTSRNNVNGALGTGADEDTGPVSPAGATTMTYTGIGSLMAWAMGGYGIRQAAQAASASSAAASSTLSSSVSVSSAPLSSASAAPSVLSSIQSSVPSASISPSASAAPSALPSSISPSVSTKPSSVSPIGSSASVQPSSLVAPSSLPSSVSPSASTSPSSLSPSAALSSALSTLPSSVSAAVSSSAAPSAGPSSVSALPSSAAASSAGTSSATPSSAAPSVVPSANSQAGAASSVASSASSAPSIFSAQPSSLASLLSPGSVSTAPSSLASSRSSLSPVTASLISSPTSVSVSPASLPSVAPSSPASLQPSSAVSTVPSSVSSLRPSSLSITPFKGVPIVDYVEFETPIVDQAAFKNVLLDSVRFP